MPKRSCPFPSTGQPLKTHVDIRRVGKEEYKKEVYLKTSQLLTQGAKDACKGKCGAAKGKSILGPVFGRRLQGMCPGCSQNVAQSDVTKCAFCDKEICISCSYVCASCEGRFCQICSVLNYEERDERAFCLSCNT